MLRLLGVKLPLPTQGFQKISIDEVRKRSDGAGNVKVLEEPETIDPLTGKTITVSESKAKYGDGTKLIYVRIDGTQTRGVGTIERITIAEYQRRYNKYVEPPKAAESIQELIGFNGANMATTPDGTYRIHD